MRAATGSLGTVFHLPDTFFGRRIRLGFGGGWPFSSLVRPLRDELATQRRV